jgi:ribonuclease E
MPNKMLVDATHPEETRVVVLRGNRVEEFDYESANRKQLRGNIYLAKVTRVEPSLQAAFIEYGGNRHGFLAFSEIHPDYYQIPTADRQALLEDEARAHADEEAEHERRSSRRNRGRRNRGAERRDEKVQSEPVTGDDALAAQDIAQEIPHDVTHHDGAQTAPGEFAGTYAAEDSHEPHPANEASAESAHHDGDASQDSHQEDHHDHSHDEHHHDEHGEHAHDEAAAPAEGSEAVAQGGEAAHDDHPHEEEEHVEDVGGADAMEEAAPRRHRHRRQYKIQEVIKRRQVMLVQVVKEERGSKGAALTTYLSLAGRYSVLMPNTARGGGISRKITNSEDRRRMKEVVEDLQVPEGMGIILRTAGQSRSKPEIKRDFEYLIRVWEQVRDLTLKSSAPTLVYEEGSLTKRSIRDLYNKDIDEIVVAGEQGYKDAKDFMRMLMPSHAKNVKLYRDSQPIFARFGIESQLDAMFSPTVQLKSGGYIVINQTEALVAIDVNSGRATREHHIEDTAVKTNIEASDEVARQLRLRDLAGLIVIDYIDMDEGRNNRTVERRLKEALKHDRARIQVGRISHFGLMEMSRQRIRTSVLESSTEKCPYCGGSGHVRSVSSVCLQLLRALEEQLMKGATHNLVVRTRSEVALYILNHKRAHLRALEDRFKLALVINSDPNFAGQMSYEITRGDQVHTPEAAKEIAAQAAAQIPLPVIEDELELADLAYEDEFADETPVLPESGSDDAETEPSEAEGAETFGDQEDGDRDGQRRRRRRGRRGRGRPRDGESGFQREGSRGPGAPQYGQQDGQQDGPSSPDHASMPQGVGEYDLQNETAAGDGAHPEGQPSRQPRPDGDVDGEHGPRRRRRGRRGGRRNRERRDAVGENGNGNGNRQNGDRQNSDRYGGQPSGEFSAGGFHTENGNVQTPAMTPRDPDFASAAPPPPPQQQAVPEPTTDTPARRRSTVREAPPSSWSGSPPAAPTPAPQPQPQPAEPAASASEGESSSQPKRGWWGKRLLGN